MTWSEWKVLTFSKPDIQSGSKANFCLSVLPHQDLSWITDAIARKKLPKQTSTENLTKREMLIAERKAILLQRDCLWAKTLMNICIAFPRRKSTPKWEGTERRCRCGSFSFNSLLWRLFRLKSFCFFWATHTSARFGLSTQQRKNGEGCRLLEIN